MQISVAKCEIKSFLPIKYSPFSVTDHCMEVFSRRRERFAENPSCLRINQISCKFRQTKKVNFLK